MYNIHMLSVQNLTVTAGGKTILRDISLECKSGKTYAVMGPNGSGKSTLASVIMGHPGYELSDQSRILYKGDEIHHDEPHERAQKGIFLSYQSPLALSGVNVYQLLRYAMPQGSDPVETRKKVHEYAKQLSIPEQLLSRPLNEGFSGGERKKMELLQAAVLDPDLIIFDEIDTGVDVDAMKTISDYIVSMKRKDRTIILITHYNRILTRVQPDRIFVIKNGIIASEGTRILADAIEEHGYDNLPGKRR